MVLAVADVNRTVGADDGAVLYQSFCALCHGADLEGTTRGPSPLSSIYGIDTLPDAAIVTAVTKGRAQQHWTFGPMPPVAGLTTPQVEAITAYLVSLSDGPAADAKVTAATLEDPALGEKGKAIIRKWRKSSPNPCWPTGAC